MRRFRFTRPEFYPPDWHKKEFLRFNPFSLFHRADRSAVGRSVGRDAPSFSSSSSSNPHSLEASARLRAHSKHSTSEEPARSALRPSASAAPTRRAYVSERLFVRSRSRSPRTLVPNRRPGEKEGKKERSCSSALSSRRSDGIFSRPLTELN